MPKKIEICQLDTNSGMYPTKENPADYLSRGLTLKQRSKAEMWFHGPQWLVSDQWSKV